MEDKQEQETAAESLTPEAAIPESPEGFSSEPDFEPLGPDSDNGGGYADDSPPEGDDFEALDGGAPDEELPKVTPFTDEEILDGTMMLVMFGFRSTGFPFQEGDDQVFADAFGFVNKQPPIKTTVLFSALGLGEALAQYGIGHGMVLGQVMNRLETLPAWVRLLLAAAGISLVSLKAMRAVMNEHRQQQNQPDHVGAGSSGQPDAGMAA